MVQTGCADVALAVIMLGKPTTRAPPMTISQPCVYPRIMSDFKGGPCERMMYPTLRPHENRLCLVNLSLPFDSILLNQFLNPPQIKLKWLSPNMMIMVK